MRGSIFSIGADASIGTDSGNDIQLRADGIEGAHARIFLESSSGKYIVEAVAGKGLRVDDMDVQESFRLEQLNIITLGGKHDFVFQVMSKDWVEAPTPTQRAGDDVDMMTRIGGSFQPLPSAFKAGPPDATDQTGGAEAGEAAEDAGMMTRIGGSFQALPQALQGTPEEEAKPSPDDDPMLRTRRAGTIAPGLPTLEGPGTSVDQSTKQEQAPFLSVVTINGTPKTYPLSPGRNVVGRSPDCPIHIDATSLSRQHAVVMVQGKTITIQDMGSKNGTFVNEERINVETTVTTSSAVRLGHTIEAILLFR